MNDPLKKKKQMETIPKYEHRDREKDHFFALFALIPSNWQPQNDIPTTCTIHIYTMELFI